MADLNPFDLKSKAFRDGQLIRPLDFAVRGMPRHFLPGEQFVDRDLAFELYEPEIWQLDDLGIHSKWFTSGIIGAALISLVVWPDTRELWRRYAALQVHRDERGSDAPGLLYELVARHQNDDRLTRRHDYQLYLFQAAMAIARAWNHHADPGHRYLQVPPLPDVPELLNQVREQKGARQTMAGFRHPKVIRRSWFEPPRPQVVHDATIDDALGLADFALTLEPTHPGRDALEFAAEWIRDQNPASELRHPAAMAGALVTLALDESCRPIWTLALAGIGQRVPNGGRIPLRDVPMSIQDCIYTANRAKEPLSDAVVLYYRILRAIRRWTEQGEHMHAKLPQAPRECPVEALWRSERVPFAPRIEFESERPGPSLGADADDEMEETGRNPASRKPSPQLAQKRLNTGRRAEEWVRRNFETLDEAFAGAALEDCRDEASGYDFKVTTGTDAWYLEVKGILAPTGRVQLSDRQWHRAGLEGDRFFLVVVADLDGPEPRPVVIRDPANSVDAVSRTIRQVTRRWEIEIGNGASAGRSDGE